MNNNLNKLITKKRIFLSVVVIITFIFLINYFIQNSNKSKATAPEVILTFDPPSGQPFARDEQRTIGVILSQASGISGVKLAFSVSNCLDIVTNGVTVINDTGDRLATVYQNRGGSVVRVFPGYILPVIFRMNIVVKANTVCSGGVQVGSSTKVLGNIAEDVYALPATRFVSYNSVTPTPTSGSSGGGGTGDQTPTPTPTMILPVNIIEGCARTLANSDCRNREYLPCNSTPNLGHNYLIGACPPSGSGYYCCSATDNTPTPTRTPTPTQPGPTATHTPTPTPTVTPPASCHCIDAYCDISCGVTSTGGAMRCSYLPGELPIFISDTATNKNNWCARPLRTIGDVDGSGSVTSNDYFYFIQAFYKGRIDANINPDVNGDGRLSKSDKDIILRNMR